MYVPPIAPYQPSLPTYTVIIYREGKPAFVTDAEGEEHARMLAVSHVDMGTGWKAAVIDDKGIAVGTFEWGTIKANRGWQS